MPAGTIWYRSHLAKHPDPRYFSRSGDYRFDFPLKKGTAQFGVLYLGSDPPRSAFIETFGRNAGRRRSVTSTMLGERHLVEIEASSDLCLVELQGNNMARIGVDSRIWSGPYSIPQAWSHSFWNHSSHPDGIYYPSRHDQTVFAAALYDRAGGSLSFRSLGTWYDYPDTPAILDHYGFGLI